MKFRKRPVNIEAVQYSEYSAEKLTEIQKFMGGKTVLIQHDKNENPKIVIETLEGDMYASLGDWIIKGVQGEFYPCKPEIFKETYEKLMEEK